MPELIAAILLWAVAAFYLLLSARMTWEVWQLRPLPALSHADAGPPASVSVIIPARDEEARIENTVKGFLAQQGVALQVVAVNDRSKDGTAAILDRLAADDGRVRPVQVAELAEGWLGKCRACHEGSLVATGDWLLFTDGDIRLHPNILARALQVVRSQQVQHVCLLFNPERGTILGRAGQLTFYLAALNGECSGVNRDRPKAYAGVGAFNLVQAAAYRAVGGHEPLRLTVLDDMKLGQLLRRDGYRTRLFHGGNEVTADWAADVRHLIKLLEKNLFSATNYRAGHAAFSVAFFLITWVLALVGPFTGLLAGAAAGLSLLSTIVPALLLASRSRTPLLPALLVPLAWPILVLALGNSAWVTLRQGGIRWRDTFYPLAVLRKGNFS